MYYNFHAFPYLLLLIVPRNNHPVTYCLSFISICPLHTHARTHIFLLSCIWISFCFSLNFSLHKLFSSSSLFLITFCLLCRFPSQKASMSPAQKNWESNRYFTLVLSSKCVLFLVYARIFSVFRNEKSLVFCVIILTAILHTYLQFTYTVLGTNLSKCSR